MDELLDRLITKCIVAEQLEIETYVPITCKQLLPILEELQSLRQRSKELEEHLQVL